MRKRITVCFLALVFCFSFLLSVSANEILSLRLMDQADLLTETEKSYLLGKLNEISLRQQLDIVIVTVDSLEGKTATDFADDYFDENGYGQGSTCDGILLLLSMQERRWAISTSGRAIQIFTDVGQEYIMDLILSYISDGNYEKGFDTFAELCDTFITQEETTGNAYDIQNLPKGPLSEKWILIAAFVGILAALIVTASMKSKMKSVHQQASASQYVINDSLNITNSKDIFLYRHIEKHEKPQNVNRSGTGGSSIHTSSSGHSHGGSSGRF